MSDLTIEGIVEVLSKAEGLQRTDEKRLDLRKLDLEFPDTESDADRDLLFKLAKIEGIDPKYVNRVLSLYHPSNEN